MFALPSPPPGERLHPKTTLAILAVVLGLSEGAT